MQRSRLLALALLLLWLPATYHPVSAALGCATPVQITTTADQSDAQDLMISYVGSADKLAWNSYYDHDSQDVVPPGPLPPPYSYEDMFYYNGSPNALTNHIAWYNQYSLAVHYHSIDGTSTVWAAADDLVPAPAPSAFDIFYSLDGAPRQRIIHAQADGNPDISGDYVVFQWLFNYNSVFLYRISTTTLSPALTTGGQYPRISGDHIVWATTTNLQVYSISGNAVIANLTPTPAYATSHEIDGNHIIWAGNDGEIYLYDIANPPAVRITNNAITDTAPVINGDYIAWQGGSNIYMYQISTGATTQISTSNAATGDHWVDDGTVMWTENLFEIYMYSAGEILNVSSYLGGYDGLNPRVSVNGTEERIYWAGEPPGATSIVYQAEVFTTDCGDAPEIITQPAGQNITPGSKVTLNVSATGDPTETLVYQWYQGQPGDTSRPVGTNSSSFTTPAINETTTYWVRVSNRFGYADSIAATLTIPTADTPADGPAVAAVPTTSPDAKFIIKQVDKALAQVGNQLTYTITFTNPKAITLQNVVITDTFDSRLQNIELVSTSLGTAVLSGNSLTIQGFALSPGQQAQVIIRATISSRAKPGDRLLNTAYFESPDASIHTSNTVETLIIPSGLPATGERSRVDYWVYGLAVLALGSIAWGLARRNL